MTGNEQRNGAESSSPAAEAPEAAETAAGEAAEKGPCVVTGVGRCGGCEADGDGGEREGDRMCRICHLSSRSGEGGSELILLGCRCKGELGFAHRHCAEAWFVVKGNRCCEICGANAKNITIVIDSRVLEEGHARRELNTQNPHDSGETQIACWRRLPVCKSLMACLIMAFLLLWFFHVSML
ncbi:hypothetical protein ZIOFF_009185 [Zingiber officinale]|uniref:RING-CH-type domain-containing protein n=1 Tax=Zingiber officinale TaxID=94328 RepID=A0A8J5HX28_ZINOF|nr:hypothetical protein ZIOFF_009185 [Zingiber officinale]